MIDVGSSTVARGVVNLVLGCLNNLVIEMAFLIQVRIKMPQVIGTHKSQDMRYEHKKSSLEVFKWISGYNLLCQFTSSNSYCDLI